jgi:hypothetical protein
MRQLRRVAAVASLVTVAACGSKKEEEPQAPPKQPPPQTAPDAGAAQVKPPPAPLPPLAADPGAGTGAPAWALPIGGLGSDVARDLAVTADGDAILCGDFEDEASFGALGKKTSAGKSDGFVLRAGKDGTPKWLQTVGGPNEETCDAVAIAGGAIVTGGLFSGELKLGEFTARSNGSDDLYVAAYRDDGAPAWLWTTGGRASDTVLAIAATPDGGVVVAGGFFGEVPFGAGVTLKAESHEDAFLAKLSADGDLAWAKRFGGERDDRIVRLAVDGQGSIFALAAFEGKASFGGDPLESAGSYDIALVKLDGDGNHLWSQRFGGVDNDGGVGLAVDPAGNVSFVGSYDQKVTVGEQKYQAAGTSDVLLARFSGDGALQWSKSLGGKGEDIGSGLAADAAGNLFVGGWFELEADLGKGSVKSKGNKDVFVMKVAADGAPRWVQTFGDRDHDKARAIALAPGGVYVAGIFRFTMNLPTPIESVRDPADKAPKTDAYLLRLEP